MSNVIYIFGAGERGREKQVTILMQKKYAIGKDRKDRKSWRRNADQ